jgi:hypothetical protein
MNVRASPGYPPTGCPLRPSTHASASSTASRWAFVSVRAAGAEGACAVLVSMPSRYCAPAHRVKV